MSKDDLEDYIRDKLEEGIEVTGDDFEGEQCHRCGEPVPFAEVQQNPDALVMWDLPLHETPGYYGRRYFCSEECLRETKNAILEGEDEPTPYGEYVELTEDQLEGNV